MTQTDLPTALRRLIWPLRLTRAGMWAERLTRAFWPLWTVLIALLAALSFGVQDHLPLEAAWVGLVLASLGAVWALVAGFRGFHAPTRTEALARLDAAMPGRPISALTDMQAIGVTDAASRAVWLAHQGRMAARAAAARAVAPDLRLARRDPYALRYLALTALVMALLFGSIWRAGSVVGLAPGGAAALAMGPTWEGWAQPPAHTGKPALYLNDIEAAALDLPAGTRFEIRFYGEVGALTLAETVSARTEPPPASDPAQTFDLVQSGEVAIGGPGGRSWQVMALADAPPTVTSTGEVEREADGQMKLPFSAKDDYGVTGGTALIALDLPAVDRRYGLAAEPEPREPVTLDLPLPISGSRADFSETLVDDLSKHPFANLPVSVTLTATDATGQTGTAAPLHITLPGKRFFDPLAAALIEMRRDLLWARSTAPNTVQVLKAVSNRPEGFIRNERAYLRLRVVMRRLEAEAATLTPEVRDELAEALWEIALLVEEGDLASALAALRRAQDRLDEAIRNGADPSEIEDLMAEMRDALNKYLQELAEEAQRNPDQQMSENMQGMEMSGDQLQQMLDELQKLMEEGRMAEAAELMEMLRQLMENMQVTQGEGGQGGGSPGQQAMRDLAETLRDQQDLSDDAFRELQDGQPGQNPGQNPGEQPGEQGQPGQPGQQPGQQPGSGGQGLAERQQELRDRLGQLNDDALPGQGSEAGEAGRQALDEAGRAMDEAERALRDGDMSGALDRQAEAMEAMRDGLRNLGEALAEDQQREGDAAQGEAFGRADPNSSRDPLGREPGDSARIGSDRNLLQGEDVYRRAQDLLDEIRRRSGDQLRPEVERDYLKRLLDLF
ncbi:TIGR02302 family protein [Paracoccaceae bacterium Fryx2]|nr:TIGR02302 family protein [Paracoccaceae bacterium Fryx2]